MFSEIQDQKESHIVRSKAEDKSVASPDSTSNPGNPGYVILPKFLPNIPAELADLGNSEISLDLQNLIDEAQFGDVFGESATGDGIYNNPAAMAAAALAVNNRTSPTGSLGSSGQASPGASSGQESPTNFQYRPNGTVLGPVAQGPVPGIGNALAYLPGSVHSGANFPPQQMMGQSNHHGQPSGVQVKQEPGAEHRYNTNVGTVSSTTNNMASNAMASYGNMAQMGMDHHQQAVPSQHPPQMHTSPQVQQFKSLASQQKYLQQNPTTTTPNPGAVAGLSGKGKKNGDRSSDEYRKRRERNNVAVRKSREKAKVRSKETEERVKVLARENERLLKKVELLQEELTVLRSLFSNVGVLPDHIHRDLSRKMESFQQQHNAMGAM